MKLQLQGLPLWAGGAHHVVCLEAQNLPSELGGGKMSEHVAKVACSICAGRPGYFVVSTATKSGLPVWEIIARLAGVTCLNTASPSSKPMRTE